MLSWIVTGVLYVLAIGGFRVVGGMSSAMDALRDWGRSTAASGRRTAASS
jgi:hypothetical protein